MPRTKRTLYFNDARHYYMYVIEPPMTLQEAWRPIDEVAGTGVDTFVYGVEVNNGLFYPSRQGIMYGDDMEEIADCISWRTWKNMHSLIDQGYDPLRVLIDRAHDRGLEFIASLRFAGYGGLEDRHRIPVPDPGILDGCFEPASVVRGGADYAHREVPSMASPSSRSWRQTIRPTASSWISPSRTSTSSTEEAATTFRS